jgi:Glycosyl transferase family 8
MTERMAAERTEPEAESPIRVYVGSEDAQMLAVRVLEYSIRQRASMDVEVFPLHHARVEFPMPKDASNRPRTPFSFQRFYIPALKGRHGRAIYLDSDMQVFKDIKALWTLPFDGADLLAAREEGESGRRPQFSVMLLNCDELRWDITEIVSALDRHELTYESLMYEMAVARRVRAAIDPTWNSLESFVENKTALLHYTDMPTQPWVSGTNRLGHLWVRDLIAAVDAGFITRQYVEEQVRSGFVRPSLTYQLDRRLEDARQLPKEAKALDEGFVAPYRKIGSHGGATGGGPLQMVRAMLGRLARARGTGH